MIEETEKARLRSLITTLTDKMVAALTETNPEGPSAADYGQALDRVCGVYRLLHGTGDLDPAMPSGLNEYQERFHTNGRQHPSGERNRRGGGRGRLPGSAAL